MLSHAYSLHVRHVCPSTAVHHIYPFIPRIILKRRLSHIIHLLNSSTSAHQAAPPRPLLRLCRLNTHAQKLISNDTLLQAFGAGLTFTRSRKSIRNRLQVCSSPKLVFVGLFLRTLTVTYWRQASTWHWMTRRHCLSSYPSQTQTTRREGYCTSVYMGIWVHGRKKGEGTVPPPPSGVFAWIQIRFLNFSDQRAKKKQKSYIMSKHCQKINRVTISYTNSADGKFEIQRCLHPDTAF